MAVFQTLLNLINRHKFFMKSTLLKINILRKNCLHFYCHRKLEIENQAKTAYFISDVQMRKKEQCLFPTSEYFFSFRQNNQENPSSQSILKEIIGFINKNINVNGIPICDKNFSSLQGVFYSHIMEWKAVITNACFVIT